MKKYLLLPVLLLVGYALLDFPLAPTLFSAPVAAKQPERTDSDAIIAHAFANQKSDLQVSGQGIVSKVLSDDRKGVRHQRFLLKLANGQTLLVAHNIDLAPRIPNLQSGDAVQFYGEYEWSHKGGVIHWTHHDPRGRHVGGWLQHQGQRYQ